MNEEPEDFGNDSPLGAPFFFGCLLIFYVVLVMIFEW